MNRFTLSQPILVDGSEPAQPRSESRVELPARRRAIPDEDDEAPPTRFIPQSYVEQEEEELDGPEQEQEQEQEPTTPAQVAAPVVPVTTHAVRKITSEEGFWNYIERMNWRDRSEDPNFNVIRKKQDYRALSISDQEAFADYLTHVVNALDVQMSAANAYGNLTDVDERKAICSHVVGKGSVFYAMTMEDPGFASYLIPESADKKEYYDMMELIRI